MSIFRPPHPRNPPVGPWVLALSVLLGAVGGAQAEQDLEGRAGVVVVTPGPAPAWARVEEGVLAALSRRGAADLRTPAQLRPTLDKLRSAGLPCDRTDTACLVKLGIFAKLDRLIVLSLDERDGSRHVDIIAIEVAQAREVGAARLRFAPDVVDHDAWRQRLDAAVAVAVAGEGEAGALWVSGPAGAEVLVDGLVEARLPWAAPLGPLPPGAHVVGAALLDGTRLPERQVVVPAGRVAAVTLEVPRAPAPLAVDTAEPGVGLDSVLLGVGAIGLGASVALLAASGIGAAAGFGVYQLGYPVYPAATRFTALYVGLGSMAGMMGAAAGVVASGAVLGLTVVLAE